MPSRCALARGLATPRACCAGAFVIFGPGYGRHRPSQQMHHTDANHRRLSRQSNHRRLSRQSNREAIHG